MRKQTIGAIALAIMLIVGSGAVLAAAPSLDEETSDTTTQTELDGTSTQTYNESTSSWLNFSADSNATAVEIRQGDDGRLLATYDNESSVMNFDSEATGTYYWNAEFADDASDYPGIEADAGESVTIEARLLNEGDDPVTSNNVSFTFANDDNVSFVHMNNSETKTADSTASGIGGYVSALNVLGNDSDVGTAEVEQEIGVNGEDQDTVVVNVANSDAQDSVAEVFDATEDSEAFSLSGVANVDGSPVPVFAEGQDLPDWFDEDMTYATVSEDGETVTVENAGETLSESDENVDISVTANDKIGFGTASSLASDYGAGWTERISLATSAFNVNGTPELEDV